MMPQTGHAMTRTNGRTDANQQAIVKLLRRCYASVQVLSGVGKGVPDILIGASLPCPHCGCRFPQNRLAEVKDGAKVPSARRFTPAEAKWHQEWKGQKCVIESEAQALELIGAERCP